MERFKKINTAMVLLVGLVIFSGVIGAFSDYVSFNWIKNPITKINIPAFLPATSQALTALPALKPDALPTAKPTNLDNLVAPIALYPDILLTQILPASTYPLEVAQAAHWLESKPDPEQASRKDWAPSIIQLLEFPQVLFYMNDQFDWMAELGDQFLTAPDAVLAAIQSMRSKALSAGLLIDSPEQRVTETTVTKVSIVNQTNQETWIAVPASSKNAQTRQTKVIYIEPANPQAIQVPQYNPLLLTLELPADSNNPTQNETPADPSITSEASSRITYSEGIRSDELLNWSISEWKDDIFDNTHQRYYQQPPISLYPGNLNGYDTGVNDITIYSDVNDYSDEGTGNGKSSLKQSIRRPWLHDPLHRRDYPYPSQAKLRFVTLKQQPALAGQRRSKAEIVNPDYAGYDPDRLKNLRLLHVKQSLSQDVSDTGKVQGDAQRPQPRKTQDPNTSASTEKPEHSRESQPDVTSNISQTNSSLAPDESKEQNVSNTQASTTADETVVDLGFDGSRSWQINVFSGAGNGSQIQKFSKRGKASRTKKHLEDTTGSKRRK